MHSWTTRFCSTGTRSCLRGVSRLSTEPPMRSMAYSRIPDGAASAVSRHLYLVKLREDGNFDTEIFSSDVSLQNLGRLGKFFMVKKAENFTPEVQAVPVDGEPQSFVKEDGFITLKVFVPAGQSRDLRIEYANDWNVGSTDVSKSGLRIALLREISDFA